MVFDDGDRCGYFPDELESVEEPSNDKNVCKHKFVAGGDHMKLNLDKNLVNLKGEPLPEKLSDILANLLATSTVGKPAKMITWAVNLTNYGEIEVDKDDIKFLTELIENNQRLINLAKAQLLEEIEKLKE